MKRVVGLMVVDVEAAKKKLRETLPILRKKYGVKSLGIFGSYVRGEQKRAIREELREQIMREVVTV
jgi:hypothetical protein